MEIVTIPCLFDNFSYLIINGDKAAVVDPSEAWPVMQEVMNRNLDLTSVLCTHHHQDHIGGIEDLLDEYKGLQIFGFHQDHKRIPLLTELVEDNERFIVCGLETDVLHTPGHTSTHIVLKIEDHLFVGDTLFGAGCGRLFEGTPEQMVNSLDRIIASSKNSKLYFGHEYTELNLRFAAQVDPTNGKVEERTQKVAERRKQNLPSSPSTLSEELATNPFLRIEDGSIVEKLVIENRLTGNDRVQVFAALRGIRNNFS